MDTHTYFFLDVIATTVFFDFDLTEMRTAAQMKIEMNKFIKNFGKRY